MEQPPSNTWLEWLKDPRTIVLLVVLLFGNAILLRAGAGVRRWWHGWRQAREEQQRERRAQILALWKDWLRVFAGYVSDYAMHYRLKARGEPGYVVPTNHDLLRRSAEVSRHLEGAVRSAFNVMVQEVANLPPPDLKDPAAVDAYAKKITAYIADHRLDAAAEAISRIAPEEDSPPGGEDGQAARRS